VRNLLSHLARTTTSLRYQVDIFHNVYAVLHHSDYRERYAANFSRKLPRIPFASLIQCHPEAAESAAKPRTPNEGPVHLQCATGAADESKDPSARKQRGPQDDKAKNSAASSVSSVVKDFDLFSQQQKLASAPPKSTSTTKNNQNTR
jgi:Type ISP C-terminal specificity domain